jgi:hypothetical protein
MCVWHALLSEKCNYGLIDPTVSFEIRNFMFAILKITNLVALKTTYRSKTGYRLDSIESSSPTGICNIVFNFQINERAVLS